jgi:hypothetical protein
MREALGWLPARLASYAVPDASPEVVQAALQQSGWQTPRAALEAVQQGRESEGRLIVPPAMVANEVSGGGKVLCGPLGAAPLTSWMSMAVLHPKGGGTVLQVIEYDLGALPGTPP